MTEPVVPPSAPAPPIGRVVVTGHTFRFGVTVPAHPKLDGHPDASFTFAEVGASMAHAMLAQAFAGARPVDLDPFRRVSGPLGGNCTLWRTRWLPHDPGQREFPKTLRVTSCAQLRMSQPADWCQALPPWHAMSVSLPDAARPADDKTAVYVCLDVAAEPADPANPFAEFVTGRPGFVLLHLTVSEPPGGEALGRAAAFVESLAESKSRVVVVTGDRSLHHLGLPLTEDSSWEAFADALFAGPPPPACERLVAAVLKCEELVVRHNAYGAVRVRGDARRLYYLLEPKQSVSAGAGFLRGHNALLGASILAEVVAVWPDAVEAGIEAGIKAGLRRCVEFEKQGLVAGDGRETRADLGQPVALFGGRPAAKAPDTRRIIGHVTIPGLTDPLRADKKWSVVDVLIRSAGTPDPFGPAAAGRTGCDVWRDRAYRVAQEIVRNGVDKAVERFKCPAVRFGQMVVTDRTAFEQVWEIQAAMLKYLGSLDTERSPLCLGVFGAPGGGKSFGVKQLAKSIGPEVLDGDPIEVNVSQYADPGELAWVFRKVRDVTLQGRVPLVFFDEFDTVRNGEAFGWLRSFLAPMQDGKFGKDPDVIEFRHGIFVFIGGLNHSLEMFNARSRDRDFIAAKGPDFVSRLARHLDVLGVAEESPDDYTHLIRRAVVLRDTLTRFQPAAFPNGPDGPALVDEDVLRGLLRVPAFRHGVRSLEAIVRTSRLSADQPRFHRAGLPPDAQLDMHVDLAKFRAAAEAPAS